MNVFEKVAKSDKAVKESMKKEGFVSAILKGIGAFAKKNPIAAVSAAADAADVASRTSQSQQAVRDAKNRANMKNLNTRV